MAIEAYGHTFQDERARDAYKAYMADKRKRSLARKMAMTDQEKSDAQTRAHFAKESKHFKV